MKLMLLMVSALFLRWSCFGGRVARLEVDPHGRLQRVGIAAGVLRRSTRDRPQAAGTLVLTADRRGGRRPFDPELAEVLEAADESAHGGGVTNGRPDKGNHESELPCDAPPQAKFFATVDFRRLRVGGGPSTVKAHGALFTEFSAQGVSP